MTDQQSEYLSFAGNLGRLTGVKHITARAALPIISVGVVFSGVQTIVSLPVFRIFNLYPDADACDCTGKLALGEKSLAAPGTRTHVSTTPG